MLIKDNHLEKLERIKYNTPQWPFKQSLLTNKSTYIGEFITSTYSGLKIYNYNGIKTISRKAEFANKICNEINSFDDLTEEAKELTEKVAEFIMNNN